jgi:hypothetical protein
MINIIIISIIIIVIIISTYLYFTFISWQEQRRCVWNYYNNNDNNTDNNNINHSIEGKIILIQKVNKQTKMCRGNKNVITKV